MRSCSITAHGYWITPHPLRAVIDNRCQLADVRSMMKNLITLTLVATLTASPAAAACYADYKAKRENPLRLHYGVIEINDSACGDLGKASELIAPRIKNDGWTLLNVLSTFGPEGLEEREGSAGKYFLRY